jgi:hypothetical protein
MLSYVKLVTLLNYDILDSIVCFDTSFIKKFCLFSILLQAIFLIYVNFYPIFLSNCFSFLNKELFLSIIY